MPCVRGAGSLWWGGIRPGYRSLDCRRNYRESTLGVVPLLLPQGTLHLPWPVWDLACLPLLALLSRLFLFLPFLPLPFPLLLSLPLLGSPFQNPCSSQELFWSQLKCEATRRSAEETWNKIYFLYILMASVEIMVLQFWIPNYCSI